MAELIRQEPGASYDELIGGHTIKLSTKVVTIAPGGGALKRGTLLGCVIKADDPEKGMFKIVDATKIDGTQYADCVLSRDVESGETAVNAEVYRSGEFNRQKLIVAAGDTADAHEAELRKNNILMTALYY